MRTLTRTLLTGTLTATLAVTATPAWSAPAAPTDDGDVVAGQPAYIDVAVATLWVGPGLERGIDAPSLADPVRPRAWSRNLQHTELRRWLTGKLETQALLGDRVQVDEIRGPWAKIVVAGQPTPRDERGYPGWVPTRQLTRDATFADRLERRRHAVVTRPTAWLFSDRRAEKRSTEVSINTELPVLGSAPGTVKVGLPGGQSAWVAARHVAVRDRGATPRRPTGADVVAGGSRFLGLRYLWAGASGFGFDCSGFTHAVYRSFGITIPRDAGPQVTVGTKVARADLQPGDLVFFAKPGGVGSIHHVAMYAGGGTILHAPNASRNVEIVDLDAFDSAKEYAGAVRIL